MKTESNLNIQQLEKLETKLISEGYRKTESSMPNIREYNITSCTGDEEHFGLQERYNLSWNDPTD
ncbi:hypothetical protein S225a_17130 [Candidatus Brocadiaceae bacterium S225]|uniref:Uncharacterized protein n=1 Tax=Candidatus Scalindua brodae TaxID=237368 RepID=A0A0B0EHA3_9BACT|nr:MAG: hypothetical protein SCABRO_02851 [Candidatus Scalindua brodae]TWU32762.1 hypothetical protein S225a_17130 [Candidatus Brocadiaceae bacterium S225]